MKSWAGSTPITACPEWVEHPKPRLGPTSASVSPSVLWGFLLTETGVIQMTGGASGFAIMGSSQDTPARSPGRSRKAAWYVNCFL